MGDPNVTRDAANFAIVVLINQPIAYHGPQFVPGLSHVISQRVEMTAGQFLTGMGELWRLSSFVDVNSGITIVNGRYLRVDGGESERFGSGNNLYILQRDKVFLVGKRGMLPGFDSLKTFLNSEWSGRGIVWQREILADEDKGAMTPQSAPGAGSGGSGGRSGYTYRRDDDRDREGFWRPWIGMGKKAEGLSYHHARTSAYRTDDCDYSRDRDYNYNNTTRTNTYVRNYDGDLGLGGRLGTDYRGGYGYQNTGEYNDGYGKYDDSFHRDDRGWSSSTMTNRYDGNRYTIGEKMMDGGYFNSSANNWDRPTNGGAGIRDRDNIRGYSHININW